MWIPDNKGLQRELIRQYYDIPQAGHRGTAKTMEFLQHKYYWPQMQDTIKQYVKNATSVKGRKWFNMPFMA